MRPYLVKIREIAKEKIFSKKFRTYIRKEENPKINNMKFHLGKPEKDTQFKSKAIRKKE
jgi:hypothetical protein